MPPRELSSAVDLQPSCDTRFDWCETGKNRNIAMINRRQALVSAAAVSSMGFPLISRAESSLVGLSLPTTGPQAEVAKDLQAGYEIALKGSGLGLLVIDDESKPEKTAENLKKFATNPSVIATSGVVGTPHAELAIPIAVQAGLPVVGIRSGAQSLRIGREGVYHLRASFEDELDKLAKLCAGAGHKQVAILFSDDSFGKGSRNHFVNALKDLNIGVLSEFPVSRNGENIDVVTQKIADSIIAAKVSIGIALLLISKPMAAAAQALRVKNNIVYPMYAMSFVMTKSFSIDKSVGLRALGIVSAFPLARISQNSIAVSFRQDAEKAERKDLFDSSTALEGYFYGRVIAAAAKTGKTRETFLNSLSRGLNVDSQLINFDKKYVGFHFLEIIRKSGDGTLRI